MYEQQTPAGPVTTNLRTGAQEAVDAELQRMADAGDWTPTGGDRIDYDYNDHVQTAQEVIGVLQRARGAV